MNNIPDKYRACVKTNNRNQDHMIRTEWQDFVLQDGDVIVNVRRRFDVHSGLRRVTRDMVEGPGDKFEVMTVDSVAGIAVWTTRKVWVVRFDNRAEQFISFPRNPPIEKTVTTQWHDFMVKHGGRITNVIDRLDEKPGRLCITRDQVEWFGDKFEAMQISPSGEIWVWVTEKVWGLNFEANLEKLLFMPRNPPTKPTDYWA